MHSVRMYLASWQLKLAFLALFVLAAGAGRKWL